MQRGFSDTMSALRRARSLNQRTAAAALHISQALLSHYENGTREPGLEFVCRACRFYGVSADYLLGLSDSAGGSAQALEALRSLDGELAELARRSRERLEVLSK